MRTPVRIRTFILGTVLALLLLPTLTGVAGWFVERGHQQASVRHQVNTAVAYLTANGGSIREPAVLTGFTALLNRLDLYADLTIISKVPPGKTLLYISRELNPFAQKRARAKEQLSGAAVPAGGGVSTTRQFRRVTIPVGTPKITGALVGDLYYGSTSRASRAVVALIAGGVALLLGLVVAVWLAGRWMVAPLTKLSAQVDRLAGGDVAIDVPRTRVGEIANIAQAVEGMAATLGDAAQQRADADEARRFLFTSIAHDLRTPLFALRGHLQAIGSRLGDPDVHLERAEARADALERLVGNLFAYTRDDYAQPALRLEALPVVDLLHDVATGLEHATRLRDNTFDFDGDASVEVMVDRDRVKRALTNVLDNAVRYSPDAAPIEVHWNGAEDSTVRITVRDHGPGIDPDLLPRVFEPGVRGTPATHTLDGGAGLGLTIAKRLLEHQAATLTAGNEPGGGAVITLTLPRAG